MHEDLTRHHAHLRSKSVRAEIASRSQNGADRQPEGVLLQDWIVSRVALHGKLRESAVDVRAPIMSLGLDSIAIFSVTGELAEHLGRDLPVTLLWDQPTIESLVNCLTAEASRAEMPE